MAHPDRMSSIMSLVFRSKTFHRTFVCRGQNELAANKCFKSIGAVVIPLLVLTFACASGVRAQASRVDRIPPKRRPQAVNPSNGKGDPSSTTGPKGSASGKRMLARLNRDTGDNHAPSDKVSVYSVAIQGGKGRPVYIVRILAPQTCGDSVYLYSYDESSRKHTRLIGLECAVTFEQKTGQFTNDYPDFIYTTGPPLSAEAYSAIIKFNGERYAQESCQAPSPSDPKVNVETPCNDRGVLKP